VRAAPVTDPPRGTAVVEIPKPLPLPGQLKPVPVVHARAGKSEKASPSDVIDSANRKATSGPDADAYFNAIMTFDYAPGALYQVYAAPLHLTSIQLQPGEKILGKPAAGDTIRWVMGVARSGAPGGEQQQYLYIKPTRAGLDATIAINTDRRIYYLELHSYENTYMAAVQWRYPHDELEQLEAQAARDESLAAATTATNINLESVNFSYRVSVEKGKPTWTPVQVFDDGRKTFVRFPVSMLTREAPALFVLSSTNETQLVNYRVKNDYYIVDRLIDRVELRVGQKDQEIVRITRDR
jgi:type IV secretion system protein VirB9